MQKKDQLRFDLPNITLWYLVKELESQINQGHMNKIQELDNNWLKVTINKDGTHKMILTPNNFFMSEYVLNAKQQSSGFGAFLNKRVENRRILSFKQHGLDRVVVFEFADSYLILELFAKGNIIITDKKFITIKPYRQEMWKDRTLKKDVPYIFPQDKRANILEINFRKFYEIIKNSEDPLVFALIENINLAPLFLEEACNKSGIDKNKPAKEVSENELKIVHKTILSFFERKVEPVLLLQNSKHLLLPFPLETVPGNIVEKFDSLNDAIGKLNVESISKKKDLGSERKSNELKISMENQKTALVEVQKMAEENKETGNKIYENYVLIKEICEIIRDMKKNGEEGIVDKIKQRFPQVDKINIKEGKITINIS
ncbi:MAG: NFACT family protein [archaeon]